MTGINHSLTGIVIAKVLPVPIALPLAFVSHFVLDSLPHFGEIFEKRKRLSKSIWAVDITVAVVINLLLLLKGEWLLLACSIVAMSPDFAWVYRFALVEKFGTRPPKPTNKFNEFHVSIQKYESRAGLVFEFIWLALMTIVLISAS